MINYSIKGWMSQWELMWLHETAKKMDSVLEIGSFMGRSTFSLCTGCKGTVFAVDKFESAGGVIPAGNFYNEFYANVGFFKNLVIFRGESIYASQFFKPKSIDMIFIDGDHTKDGVIRDIQAWAPICKKLLSGHDLRPWPAYESWSGFGGHESGVEDALKELKLDYKLEVDSIWTCEKF